MQGDYEEGEGKKRKQVSHTCGGEQKDSCIQRAYAHTKQRQESCEEATAKHWEGLQAVDEARYAHTSCEDMGTPCEQNEKCEQSESWHQAEQGQQEDISTVCMKTASTAEECIVERTATIVQYPTSAGTKWQPLTAEKDDDLPGCQYSRETEAAWDSSGDQQPDGNPDLSYPTSQPQSESRYYSNNRTSSITYNNSRYTYRRHW